MNIEGQVVLALTMKEAVLLRDFLTHNSQNAVYAHQQFLNDLKSKLQNLFNGTGQ